MSYNQETSENNNEKIVLRPIIFLDLFDYPVTAFEVWHYLDKKQFFSEVIEALDKLVQQNIISKKNGFYYLLGRGQIVDTRLRRYNYSCTKIKKAQLFIKPFSFLPFIKSIAVANFIGAYNLRQGSDIDFFIITSANRIWLSRFISAGLAKILRLRPTKQNKKNKICLSFYISEVNLDLKKFELSDGDPYFYYWLRGLKLIHDKNNTWQKFKIANHLLLDNNLNALDNFKQEGGLFISSKPKCNWLGRILEKLTKKIQLKIMAQPLRSAMNKSDGVVISDQILKLYLVDNRREFANKFNLKINEVFAKIN